MFASPADLSSVLLTSFGILLSLMIIAALLDRADFYSRVLFGLTTAGLIVTYANWRWHDTLPRLEMSVDRWWPYLFFGFELVAILYTVMSIVIVPFQ